MTLKNYLLVMSVLTAICWGIFFFVAGMIDPFTTNWLGFVLFYSSLFLALSGLAALVGFLFRFVILKKDLAFQAVKVAFRQSFLFSLFLIAALFLKAGGLLNWLNTILLIIAFAILELFLTNYKKSR